MQSWVDVAFADGTYTFKLGLAQIAELERKCDAGLGAIYARTLRGRYGFEADAIVPDSADFRFGELVEIIRQGLIGGGQGVVDGQDVKVNTIRANQLVQTYVIDATEQRAIVRDTWALAYVVLRSLIEGYDPGPKAEPADEPATPTSGSTTPKPSSTAP